MATTRLPPSPVGVLRGAWRRLRTMRTAIILLLLVAAAASVGSFFPQRPVDSRSVADWIERNPSWSRIAEFFGLFDVYGAWWFMALYALLLVSLVGCLIPRYRALWRTFRAEPYVSASLRGQPRYAQRRVPGTPEDLLGRAEATLRRKRFKVRRAAGTVAAERGIAREGGSLLFHTSFLVLLLGVSIGKVFGFEGQVAVVEGESFVDTPIEYSFRDPGRWFGDRYTGLELALDEFQVSWYPDGTPREFVSRVRLLDDGRQIREEVIEVNHPLRHGGLRVYQLSWGWAPHVRVAQEGRVLYDGPTVFLSRDGRWQGVAKVPQAEPQEMGLDMLFFPDLEVGEDGIPRDRSQEPKQPVIVFQQMLGDLNLDRPQSVFELDPRGLTPAELGAIRPGETARLPGGIEISFVDLQRYSVFGMAQNPGTMVLFVAAVLLLVGLVPALYSSRRRVWVRAEADGDATRVEFAGHALQRKDAFDAEFADLVRELAPEGKVPTGVPGG